MKCADVRALSILCTCTKIIILSHFSHSLLITFHRFRHFSSDKNSDKNHTLTMTSYACLLARRILASSAVLRDPVIKSSSFQSKLHQRIHLLTASPGITTKSVLSNVTVDNHKIQQSSCSKISTVDEGLEEEEEQVEMFTIPHKCLGHDKIEWNGPTRGGRYSEPTRFGDWERKGRCSDF